MRDHTNYKEPPCWDGQENECMVIASLDYMHMTIRETEIDGIVEVCVTCNMCGAQDVWIE